MELWLTHDGEEDAAFIPPCLYGTAESGRKGVD